MIFTCFFKTCFEAVFLGLKASETPRENLASKRLLRTWVGTRESGPWEDGGPGLAGDPLGAAGMSPVCSGHCVCVESSLKNRFSISDFLMAEK